MKLFCSHDYHIEKDYEMKSVFQQMMENGLSKIEGGSMSRYLFNSKQVIVFKCSKCNKLKTKIIAGID